MHKITPFLWFDNQAEEAAKFYVAVFGARLPARQENSKITAITYYPKAAEKVSGKKAGSVMTVEFQLRGQPFAALNGGEPFKLSEAVSFAIDCQTQEEVDYFWENLKAGGDEKAQVCGWLKDKFGLSWQVVPTVLNRWLKDPDPIKSERVMEAMLKMKKIDIEILKRAYEAK